MPDIELLIPRCPRCSGALEQSDNRYSNHAIADCEAEWKQREQDRPNVHPIQVDLTPRCTKCGQDLIPLDRDIGTFYRHEPAYCEWSMAEHAIQMQAIEAAQAAKRADPAYGRICRCGETWGEHEPTWDWCGVPVSDPREVARVEARLRRATLRRCNGENLPYPPTRTERLRKRLTGTY